MKKLKFTIIASFKAKIGWKMPIKRKNKNYRSIPLLNDAKLKIPKKIAIKLKKLKYNIIAAFQAKIVWKMPRKFQKNSKKIQKIKKYYYGFISCQNRLEKDEKERK